MEPVQNKLAVGFAAIDIFLSSVTLDAMSQMHTTMQDIWQMLREQSRTNPQVARSIVGAGSRTRNDWAPLESILRTQGVPGATIEQLFSDMYV